VEQAKDWFSKQNDLQKKIVLVAAAILTLMILFPPKVIVRQILGQSTTQPVGYQFIFSDPAGAEKPNVPADVPAELKEAIDKAVTSHIEWGKLLIQMIVVAGVAVVAMRFVAAPNIRGVGNIPS